MPRIKVLSIFGTRPEAIKMAPVIRSLRERPDVFKSVLCITAQHREMLDQVLDFFEITPDHDLDIMTRGQDLFDLTARMLTGLRPILQKERPDIVLVQGDTTTAFTAALAAFYMRIPSGHVEAGLRTADKYSPFPEEANRRLIGGLADYHFAPTELAKQRLISENVNHHRIWVTGNTVIDALLTALDIQRESNASDYWERYFAANWNLDFSRGAGKVILVTGHRRESFGGGFENICNALRELASRHPDATIVYPVHLNPNVQRPVYGILGDLCAKRDFAERKSGGGTNVFLIDPVDYPGFVWLMEKAYIILTDSGGIQEEAPSLGKPVLVMRNNTERTEGVDAGTCMLVGTDTDTIVRNVERLLGDEDEYDAMAKRKNPYGDGRAGDRIVDILSGLNLKRGGANE